MDRPVLRGQSLLPGIAQYGVDGGWMIVELLRVISGAPCILKWKPILDAVKHDIVIWVTNDL